MRCDPKAQPYWRRAQQAPAAGASTHGARSQPSYAPASRAPHCLAGARPRRRGRGPHRGRLGHLRAQHALRERAQPVVAVA